MKLLEVKKPPPLFAYFNHSYIYVHISAQTLRRQTAERAQKVLRSSVMDKMTIKKDYLPGKLWSGSLSHCFVAILMFLIAAGLIPDGCFPIATTRTYKKRNALVNQSSVRGHEKLDCSTRHLIYLKILTWFEWHLGCQPGLALVTMETPQRDIWWCQQYKTYWWSRISGKKIREGQAQSSFFINKLFRNPRAL